MNQFSDEQFIQPGICDNSEWRKNENKDNEEENRRLSRKENTEGRHKKGQD